MRRAGTDRDGDSSTISSSRRSRRSRSPPSSIARCGRASSGAENGRAIRAIVVTSPNKGDGKSLTAANLALTMAQEFQQRVLLVDADLRRPTLHRLFGLRRTPGLTDVLMGGAS